MDKTTIWRRESMKKKLLILICLLLTACLYGCSHKSNAELVDVEQFRCQDSIDTVFDVLGKVELKEYGYPSYLDNRDIAYYERGYYIIFADIKEPSYYLYENVNLFGFKGYVVFDVREDEETIQGIYCNLTLTDKEFEELIGYFSDKYGSYEVDDFGETIKTYKWTISEANGMVGYESDEIGYDEIVIENRGDDKYIIALNDEWSFTNDETYFNKVEQAKKTENAPSTVIAQGEYDVCGDVVSFSVIVSDDKIHFVASANTKDIENAHTMVLFLYASCETIKEACDEYTLRTSYENGGSVTISWDGSEYSIRGMNEDGTAVLSSPDWYQPDEVSLSGSELEEYQKAFETAWAEFAEELDKNIN